MAMPRFMIALYASAALAVLAASARAQEIQLTGPLTGAPAVSRYSYRSRYGNRIVMPSGSVELGGEMAFVTAEDSPDLPALDFSDLALLRLRARRSFSDSLELLAATTLLPKQPSSTSEPVWQGAFIGARMAFAESFAASVDAGGGPMLDGAGRWWKLGPGMIGKFEAGHLLRFALNAGGALTLLDYDEPSEQPFWLEEVTTGAEVQFGSSDAACWVRLDYDIPVAHNPEPGNPDRLSGRALDPQIGLSVQVGGIISQDDWDVFATYSVNDRGELTEPDTTLPILDGGFDQIQIVIGVQHQFGYRP